MAKRTRAPARRSRATNTARRTRKTGRNPRKPASRARKAAQPQSPSPVAPAEKPAATRRAVGVPITYTPELLANGRYRYECTDESRGSIAADLGINRNTLRNLALREGWKPYVAPPRGLLPAAQLVVEAEKLVEIATSIGHQPQQHVRPEGEDASSLQPPQENAKPAAEGAAAGVRDVSAMFEQITRRVQDELNTIETMRAQLKREPQSPLDAERTARTLSCLTEVLQKLQRLQCGVTQTGSNYDDIPDADEFRRRLARRIDAFVTSRTERRDAAGDSGARCLGLAQ